MEINITIDTDEIPPGETIASLLARTFGISPVASDNRDGNVLRFPGTTVTTGPASTTLQAPAEQVVVATTAPAEKRGPGRPRKLEAVSPPPPPPPPPVPAGTEKEIVPVADASLTVSPPPPPPPVALKAETPDDPAAVRAKVRELHKPVIGKALAEALTRLYAPFAIDGKPASLSSVPDTHLAFYLEHVGKLSVASSPSEAERIVDEALALLTTEAPAEAGQFD